MKLEHGNVFAIIFFLSICNGEIWEIKSIMEKHMIDWISHSCSSLKMEAIDFFIFLFLGENFTFLKENSPQHLFLHFWPCMEKFFPSTVVINSVHINYFPCNSLLYSSFQNLAYEKSKAMYNSILRLIGHTFPFKLILVYINIFFFLNKKKKWVCLMGKWPKLSYSLAKWNISLLIKNLFHITKILNNLLHFLKNDLVFL